jgi:hypothetical protein
MSTILASLDSATLLPLVERATGHALTAIGQWSAAPISGGAGQGLGVYRLQGTADGPAGPMRWSLVMKVLAAQGHTPGDPDGWQREALAYQSGLLQHLPGSIGVPRCYGVTAQPGIRQIWLEDLGDIRQEAWSLADYRRVAGEFGRMNAAYLTGTPLPQDAWLARGWHRRVERHAGLLEQLGAARNDKWVRRIVAPHTTDALLELWRERASYLRILEALPQTLCHRDAMRRNLVRRQQPGHEQTVAFDWAYAGFGALGEELAPLVAASVMVTDVGLLSALELEAQALAGYAEGLRGSGWDGDIRLARLGYAAAAVLRYSFDLLEVVLPLALDPGQHATAAARYGFPFSELCEGWAIWFARFSMRLIDEVGELQGLDLEF